MGAAEVDDEKTVSSPSELHSDIAAASERRAQRRSEERKMESEPQLRVNSLPLRQSSKWDEQGERGCMPSVEQAASTETEKFLVF